MASTSVIDAIYGRMDDDLEKAKSKPEISRIQQFFAGKTILLTGATGFMGKCFVEKILRECPNLKRLYVLVRPKQGVPPEEKMKKYFQLFIFDRLRSINPNFADKVVTINGDLQENRLAISEENRQTLIEEVDIIVHNGATVKFNEIVNVCLKINVMGTKHMLDLAMECKHVQAFMYVSTAYSHCYRKQIEEKFYDPPGDLKMVKDIIHSDLTSKFGVSEEAMKMLIGNWPNVYTFTKAMAEELVRQYGEKANFACGVFRPSIVTASLREPIKGWTGNLNGPAYGFLGVTLGVIHTVYNEGHPMDLIPADYCINALIAAIYDIPERWAKEKRPVVYNFGSSTVSPISVDVMYNTVVKEGPKLGSMHTVWHHFLILTSNKILFYILHILFHFFPAILADMALLIMGKKPKALSLFFFATKHMDKIDYFLNGNWRIEVPQMRKVLHKLTDTDKLLFPFDMMDFDWEAFVITYMHGGRVYLMNEPLDNIEVATKRYRRMRILHYATATAFFLLLGYYLIRLFNCLFSYAF